MMNDKEITIKINNANVLIFKWIQFLNFVHQVFLDFHDLLNFAERLREPIQGFLLWHTNLKNMLYLYLSSHSRKMQKYKC